jgi:geranylgeranyl pyrophosphate synthase
MPLSLSIEAYLADRRSLVQRALDAAMAGRGSPLDEPMRYSINAGGKRLRPILVLAAAEAVGGGHEAALPVAVAFELVHTQSLIYDDLPCMDDDAVRRGLPTNHMVFGESTALLAGSTLMARAFALIAMAPLAAERRLSAVVELAAATEAMSRGQQLDLAAHGWPGTPDSLQELHRLKTGALMAGALRAGGTVGGGGTADVDRLGRYGEALGLAFQIVDDLLDGPGEEAGSAGAPGRQIADSKLTYPALFGREASQDLAREAGERALAELDGWGDAVMPLRALVPYVLGRTG